MATPAVQIQAFTFNTQVNDDALLKLQVNAPDGTPIDVSTGFSAHLRYQSASVPIRGTSTALTVAAAGTVGGVLSITAGKDDLNGVPCNENIPAQVLISNDAFATSMVLANGFLRNTQLFQ
jgi:hypothetical protein